MTHDAPAPDAAPSPPGPPVRRRPTAGWLLRQIAFWVLGLNWTLLGIFAPLPEHRHWLHALRLVAFALIGFGIVDKNRRQSP